jgi:O-methyltransferase
MRFASEATELGERIDQLPERCRDNFPDIQDEMFWQLYAVASRYSLLHISGFLNLYQSLRYIQANQLPGDIVECGCFLGGASIFVTMLRDCLKLSDKDVWLFDTFEGFPEGEQDALVGSGQVLHSVRYENFQDSVRTNFAEATPDSTGVHFVQGYVEETLLNTDVRSICLLRLDTDFYTSTLAELNGLYHRLVRGGVLIVDDYGLFEGSRRATDEFLGRLPSPPLLNRIDRSVWVGVKP